VDRGSRAGIRAYNTEGEEPLDPALSDWALAEAEVDDLVAAIDGDRYTDFSASGVDELAGLSDIKLHVGTAGPEQLEYEVAELIGHLPGRCSRCRLPRQSAEAKAFQAALRA
jgi:hypothetical protein